MQISAKNYKRSVCEMTFFKKLRKYYLDMSRFSFKVLAITVSASLMFYIAAMALFLWGGAMMSPDLAQYAAVRLANMGYAATIAGLLLCVLSDVIIKYDRLEEDNT